MPTPDTNPDTLGIDFTDPSKVQLLQVLSMLAKDYQGNRQPIGAADIVSALLGEQRQRATAQAKSVPKGANYYPGLNPGGLADTLSAFIGKVGGTAPRIEMGARGVNRVPLANIGGGIPEGVLPMAGSIMDMTKVLNLTGGGASPWDAKIMQLADALLGNTPEGAATASAPGGMTNEQARVTSVAPPKNTGNPAHPLPATSGSLQPPRGSGGVTGGVPNGFNPSAAANLIANMMQRAPAVTATPGIATPTAPTSRPNYGPKGPNYSKPIGQKDGGTTVEGPALLRVGERPPGDKKYATEEVVMAAPGTVVAPVPKGMENPSHEDAMGLIMAQILKNKKREVAPKAQPGHSTPGAEDGATISQEFNPMDLLTMLTQAGQFMANYDLGLQGLGQKKEEFGFEKQKYGDTQGWNWLKYGEDRAQQQTANQQAAQSLGIQEKKVNNDYALGVADQGFNRLMAGVRGASLRPSGRAPATVGGLTF